MHPDPPPAEARQAVGFAIFFITIAVAAVLWGVLDPAASDIFSMTLSQSNSQQADAIIKERRAIWRNLLFFPVLLGSIALIAAAARLSQT